MSYCVCVSNSPRLVAITNCQLGERALMVARLRHCCELAVPGTVQILLRDPELSVRERLALGEQLRQMTYNTGQFLSVRDRLDLAILLNSDGVHLGERSVHPAVIRERYGSRFYLSVAWHALDKPPPSAVDAVLLSPVCAPRKNQPAIGASRLERFVSDNPQTRVYALGGVDAQCAQQCLGAGARGVAVIGAVLSADDPLPLLRSLGIAKLTHES